MNGAGRGLRIVRALVAAFLVGLGSSAAADPLRGADLSAYTAVEQKTLRSLWIGSLGPIPDDPSNAYDTDPAAATLGRRLFFDPRFSANGTLACATCHRPELSFQDGKSVAEGLQMSTRRSMPLAGVAYNTWFFWDGRKDSLWAQAAAPLENPRELGLSRDQVAALVRAHYRGDYEAIFGPVPEPDDRVAATRVLVNVAKSIAAFVRTIQPGPARFDRYVQALLSGEPVGAGDALTPAETRGLKLFIGKAGCTNCHSGPLLTNGEFHFSRVPQPQGNQDGGRGGVVAAVMADEFACTGAFSDAARDQCSALRFLSVDARDAMHAFKTPSLRNVAARAPYMHAGQLATLGDVLRFYRDHSEGIPEMGHGNLSDAELGDLEAFLGTLSGPISALGQP